MKIQWKSKAEIEAEIQTAEQEKQKRIEKSEAVEKLAQMQVESMALTMAPEQIEQVQVLFDVWDGNGIAYKVGKVLNYEDVLYKVLQAHTSQSDWVPDKAVSLFAKVLTDPNGGILPWVQPESTNPYQPGDKVTHKGKTWECTAPNNVWEPGVYGWKDVM